MATPEVKEDTKPVESGQQEVIKPAESQAEASVEQPVVSEQPSQGAQPQPQQQQPSDDTTYTQPADDTPVFAIPQDEKTLEEEAKGPIENPLTWFANFWLRMAKKAIYLGKRIIIGTSNEQ